MGLGGDDGRLGNPAGLVVAVAFGGDAMGAVLGAGAGPARHHRGALPAAVGAGRLGCGRVTEVAGRFEGSRDDRPLLGYDTPTGLTCPYTTPLDVTLLLGQ
ncbi:hypothetical protein [Mycobacterium tuberculosis]|nr:hypothetical protein [Mycobacterium tuberculosis]